MPLGVLFVVEHDTAWVVNGVYRTAQPVQRFLRYFPALCHRVAVHQRMRLFHIYQVADTFHVRLSGEHPQVAYQHLFHFDTLSGLVAQPKAQGVGSASLQADNSLPSFCFGFTDFYPVTGPVSRFSYLRLHNVCGARTALSANDYNRLISFIALEYLIVHRSVL
jgi:hypothetical protein